MIIRTSNKDPEHLIPDIIMMIIFIIIFIWQVT